MAKEYFSIVSIGVRGTNQLMSKSDMPSMEIIKHSTIYFGDKFETG